MFNDANPMPLHLTEGELLSPLNVEGARYAFQFVPFSGITVLQPPKDVNLSEVVANPQKFFPQNIDRTICFYPMDALASGFIDEDGTPAVMNMKNLEGLDSGFISPNGTLMPQFIYPLNYGRNRMFLDPLEAEKASLEEETALTPVKSFKWICQPVSANLSESQMQNQEILEEVMKWLTDKQLWGKEQILPNSSESSVINITGKHDLIDGNGPFQRSFICDFPETGAFAFLMDIRSSDSSQGNDNPPYFKLEIGSIINENEELLSVWECDQLEVVVKPDTNPIVTIYPSNGKQPSHASEPLTFSGLGMKIEHINYLPDVEKHVFFCYPLLNSVVLTGDLVTSNESEGRNIICKKDKDFDISKKTKPKMSMFPTEHKQTVGEKANCVKVGNDDSYITIGSRARVTWNQCSGTFGFTPLRFTSAVVFSFFFKADGQQVAEYERQGQLDVYVCLEIGGNNFNYTGLEGFRKAIEIDYDAATRTKTYRVDFVITAETPVPPPSDEDGEDGGEDGDEEAPEGPLLEDGEISDTSFDKTILTLQKYPFELFGMIVITRVTGQLNTLKNDDGNFGIDFDAQNTISEKLKDFIMPFNSDFGEKVLWWTDFLTTVSISHNLEGSSGSLTLDKFTASDSIMRETKQSIGAITLVANNGLYLPDGITVNEEPYTFTPHEYYKELPWGQVFRGYGMEIGDTANEGSTTHSVTLVGVQKKLADMKLVNCPFWDGDAVFDQSIPDCVLNYFISYTGCDIRYVPAFSRDAGDLNDPDVREIILPRSHDWASPAVNFTMGTTCLDALKEVAKFINHQFIIQPDGCCYFYKMDEYGAPTWITNGPIVMEYNEKDIMSFNIKPYLENRYNTFLTLGLLVKKGAKGVNGLGNGLNVADGAKPGMVLTQDIQGFGNFPWSKLMVNHQQGFVTMEQLEKFHDVNVRFSISDMYTGQIEVPGFHALYLYDKIRINCDNGQKLEYYISGISHNFDLTQKDWTTSLEIASFKVSQDTILSGNLV